MPPGPSRRQFGRTGLIGLAGFSGITALAAAPAAAALPTLRARRLRPGDTLGLVSPANATFEREPLKIAIESLQAPGAWAAEIQARAGASCGARQGAGEALDRPQQRAGNAAWPRKSPRPCGLTP